MAKQKKVKEKKIEAAPPPSGAFTLQWRWGPLVSAAFWAPWAALVLWFYLPARLPFFSLELWGRVLPPFWDIGAGASLASDGFRFLKLAAFIAVCAGLGRAILRRLVNLDPLNRLESLGYSYGLGTGAVGLLMWALGMTHLLRTATVAAVSLACAALAAYANKDLAQSRQENSGLNDSGIINGPLEAAAAALTAFLFLLYGFYALAPEVFYDSLVYHLALPALYRFSNGFTATPMNVYSGIPMQAEMLYLWSLFAGDEILARLIHWSMGLGLACAFLGAALRARRPLAGWLACVLFFATPLVAMSLWRTAVEGYSSYLLALAALALIPALSQETACEQARGLRRVSALCLGLAMGTKYTNWPDVGVFSTCLLAAGLPFADAARYAAAALACIVPWLVRNVVLYRDPIFPYFDERFNPNAEFSPSWHALQGDAWARDWHSISAGGWRSVAEVLAHPWFMTMKGASDADFLGPLFLAGLPALLLLRGKDRSTRVWLWLLAGLWLCWWPLTAMPRFFMPGLALLGLWVAWSIDTLSRPWARGTAAALVLALALNNAFWVGVTGYQMEAWPAITGSQSKGDYLSHSHSTYPSPYYPAAQWLDEHAPADARVLVVGDGRSYYIPRRAIAASALDPEVLVTWVNRASDAKALKAKLDANGVTYLWVNMAEFMRLHRYEALTVRDIGILSDFMHSYARKEFSDQERTDKEFRWDLVYRVAAEGSSPPDNEESPLIEWSLQQSMKH